MTVGKAVTSPWQPSHARLGLFLKFFRGNHQIRDRDSSKKFDGTAQPKQRKVIASQFFYLPLGAKLDLVLAYPLFCSCVFIEMCRRSMQRSLGGALIFATWAAFESRKM